MTSSIVLPAQGLVLAQVTTPTGVGYVPDALNEQGLLVQRRYRGVGAPVRTPDAPTPRGAAQLWEEHYYAEDTLTPILHPGAVRAAGLAYAPLAEYAQQFGLRLGQHPTYGPLCLRWGANAHGYHVGVAPAAAGTLAGTFTPVTDWSSGITYYQPALESLTATPTAFQAALAAAPGRVERPGVGDGSPAWAFTDAGALARLAAAHGEGFAVQQRTSVYTVELAPHPGAVSHRWPFATAEAARSWYRHLAGPTERSAGGESYPQLRWLASEYLLGQCVSEHLNQDCSLPVDWLALGALPPVAEDEAAGPLPGMYLTETERPRPVRVPTLAELLAQAPATDAELARRLGLSLAALRRRLLAPSHWRLAELRRVAEVTHCAWPALLARLDRELNG
ncbi:hypothetical protein [Hymenobacter crusticola]|uniref:Uncharacterized protein n=1 Tax=Hymenobacter crusticola TaxID=1770526 RepID=A0A243W699_9BACT|nr:hypothetical protein [Hymenobacter crusticola]OUJ69885.1 hypothetical protein BXP70_25810 [Hymenobacter crusticola]